jgi:hypothetical protein
MEAAGGSIPRQEGKPPEDGSASSVERAFRACRIALAAGSRRL